MLTQQEIETILRPHHQKFEECYHDGITDFNKHYDEVRHVHTKSWLALTLRNHVVYHARRIFGGMINDGVQLLDYRNGLFCVEFSGEKFGISGSIWTRFKKLNSNLLTANIPTKQVCNFNAQKPLDLTVQPYLTGESWDANPKDSYPSYINAGYIPNEIWRDFKGLYFTHPNGQKSITWVITISRDEKKDENENLTTNDGNIAPTIVAFPVQTIIEEQRPKVKAKSNKEERREKTGTGEV